MITAVKEKKIRRLLHHGRSISEVAETLNLPEDVVKKVIGISNLPQKKIQPITLKKIVKHKKRTCLMCGSRVLFLPCLACNPEAGRGRAGPAVKPRSPNKIPHRESLKLLRIAEDLREIKERELILHPLFISLSKRAEDILARITVF